MSSITVRISPRAHRTLKAISKQTGRSMPMVLDEAIENYRRRRFLEGLHADFAALRRNPKAWESERRERAEWDATIGDDLEKP